MSVTEHPSRTTATRGRRIAAVIGGLTLVLLGLVLWFLVTFGFGGPGRDRLWLERSAMMTIVGAVFAAAIALSWAGAARRTISRRFAIAAAAASVGFGLATGLTSLSAPFML